MFLVGVCLLASVLLASRCPVSVPAVIWGRGDGGRWVDAASATTQSRSFAMFARSPSSSRAFSSPCLTASMCATTCWRSAYAAPASIGVGSIFFFRIIQSEDGCLEF